MQVHLALGEQETHLGEKFMEVYMEEYLAGEIYELIGNKTNQRLERLIKIEDYIIKGNLQ